jgi:hypothetical protein
MFISPGVGIPFSSHVLTINEEYEELRPSTYILPIGIAYASINLSYRFSLKRPVDFRDLLVSIPSFRCHFVRYVLKLRQRSVAVSTLQGFGQRQVAYLHPQAASVLALGQPC